MIFIHDKPLMCFFHTAVQEKENHSSDASNPDHSKDLLSYVIDSDLLLQVTEMGTCRALQYVKINTYLFMKFYFKKIKSV